jgi:hypothetical protein
MGRISEFCRLKIRANISSFNSSLQPSQPNVYRKKCEKLTDPLLESVGPHNSCYGSSEELKLELSARILSQQDIREFAAYP